MSHTTLSLSIVAAAFGLTLVAAPARALACGGHAKDEDASFQRADKNGDGFLTQVEVGTERWQKISVADANQDKKVSKAELMQAYKDGKLGKKNKQA